MERGKQLSIKLALVLCLTFSAVANAQIQFGWQYAYGSMEDDEPWFICKTSSGYIVGGDKSPDGGFSVDCDDVESHGWILKLDETGRLVDQLCTEMVPTNISKAKGDNPYYYAFGMVGVPPHNYSNACVLKIDEDLNVIWERALGNPNDDYWLGLIGDATDDGGCIGTIAVASAGGDVSQHFGTHTWDAWVFKLDEDSNIQWDVTLGSLGSEEPTGIRQLAAGGYMVSIGGSTQANGSIGSCHDSPDIIYGIVVWLDANGNVMDSRCYGGSRRVDLFSTFITIDDGYVFLGYAMSEDGDLEGSGYHLGYHQGNPSLGPSADVWMMKTDFDGNVIWSRCYGGTEHDFGHMVFQNEDGGFTIFGNTWSRDGDAQSAAQLYEPIGPNIPVNKPWIIRTDSKGYLIWERAFGADEASYQFFSCATRDSETEYTLVCRDPCYPSPIGDINCPNVVNDSWDNYWVFHITDVFDYDEVVENQTEGHGLVYPNPANETVTIEGVEACDIEIYNALGQLVKTMQGTNEISVAGLPEGVYVLRITDEKGNAFTERVSVGRW